MASSIDAEVITTGIALISGALGYAIREYRNRVHPFFQVVKIDGSISRRLDQSNVTEDIVGKLQDTFYIKPIEAESTLGEIWDHWDRSDDLKQAWPEVRPLVDRILDSSTDEDLMDNLHQAFEKSFFERWMMLLLVNNRLSFPGIPTGLDEKVPVYEADEHGGSVWFDFPFPSQAVNFGMGLQNTAVKAKSLPFIDAIRYLHRDTILSVGSQYKDILEKEYQAAIESIHDLRKVLNESSRWCFFCYFANMSSNPIIVENKGLVTVVDPKTKLRFSENCYIALIREDSDGEARIADTTTPIVFKGGQDVTFVMITEHTQSEMDLGNALRETFDRGASQCRLTVWIRRVGLLKRQKYSSQHAPFISSGKTPTT